MLKWSKIRDVREAHPNPDRPGKCVQLVTYTPPALSGPSPGHTETLPEHPGQLGVYRTTADIIAIHRGDLLPHFGSPRSDKDGPAKPRRQRSQLHARGGQESCEAVRGHFPRRFAQKSRFWLKVFVLRSIG